MSFLADKVAAAAAEGARLFWAVLLDDGKAGRFWILGSPEAESLVVTEPDPFFHLDELSKLLDNGASASDVRVVLAAKRTFGATVIAAGPEDEPLDLGDSRPPLLPASHRTPKVDRDG